MIGDILGELAKAKAQIVVDADTLREIIREDRQVAFMDGMRYGKQVSIKEPYTKSQAAMALGFSEGTIDNLRRRGELESWEYGGQVRIEVDEIERFKRTHKSLYAGIVQEKKISSKLNRN